MGDSDGAAACICKQKGRRAQQRNNGFYQHFCLRESAPPALALSSSPHVPGPFGAATPALELRAGQSLCESHVIKEDKDDVMNRHEVNRNAFSGAFRAPGNARCWEESWLPEVPIEEQRLLLERDIS